MSKKKDLKVKLGYKLTNEQVRFIVRKREEGLTFGEISGEFNYNFADELDRPKSEQVIRAIYEKFKNEDLSEDGIINTLKQKYTTLKRNAQLAKENKVIVQNLVYQEELLETIKDTVKKLKVPKINTYKPKKSKNKTGTTLEVMLSDLHFGKLTKDFNQEIAEKRLDELMRAVYQEISSNEKHYKIDEIILAALGDIIESSTMHLSESLVGCEFGNSEQVTAAIKTIFERIIVPVAKTGYKVTFIGVTGNHDRTEQGKTYNMAGKHNLTWIIYNTLKFLTQTAGLKNVTFHIPEESYYVYKIYNNYCLYEHGDNCKGNTKVALENHLRKRADQHGYVISYFRLGHFHEYVMFGRGKIIANGSLPGQDSYSETLGFVSEPIQVINQYCQTQRRDECFYRSFPVLLKSKRND